MIQDFRDIPNFRDIPTFREDYELGRSARRAGGKVKCPFPHVTEQLRRMAWFSGLNFEKGMQEGFGGTSREKIQSRSFSAERESGFMAGILGGKRSAPVPIRSNYSAAAQVTP